jgi:non-specific serine/threonine protein kinase
VKSEAYRIGPFVLDASTDVLTRDGAPVALGKRAVAVLATLVRSSGVFVPKARILEAAWPGLVVQESNLAVQVLSIRRALAQAEGGAAWLETLPKRGYRFVGPVARLDDAPAMPAGAPPTNLSAPLTSFVGREREQAEVASLLDAHRLVTLIGAGGVGKTRLALRVAASAAARFPDGVWLVELSALTDPGLVPQAVGAVLGHKEQPHRRPLDTLAESLRAKRLLVVLDNAEHLLAACTSLVEALLRLCPQVAWLVTSRERLAGPRRAMLRRAAALAPRCGRGVDARESRASGCCAAPERARAPPPAALRDHRRQRGADRRHLPPARWPAAGDRACGGAPAHARSERSSSSASTAASRCWSAAGRRCRPGSRRLRTALDWSHDLLDDAQRLLLARLSVFAGGFALDAAERVCAGDGIEAGEVLDLLTALADKSLVIVEERGGDTRYRLLDSIRDYAAERLDARGETARCRARHFDRYLALAREAEPQLTGRDQLAWLERLDAEHDNLRAALAHALAASDDAQAALGLVTAISRFWFVRGHVAEGRAWLDRVLALRDGAATTVRGKARNWAGVFAWKQRDYAASRHHYEEALAIRRALGDRGGVGAVLSNLGLLAFEQGDYAAALDLHEQSLAIDRELGDRWGVAVSLMHLGEIAATHGDLARARAYDEESLAIFRELGDRAHVANALRHLGTMSLRQGDAAGARTLCGESLAICRELGDRSGIAWALDGLGTGGPARRRPRRRGPAARGSADDVPRNGRSQGHRRNPVLPRPRRGRCRRPGHCASAAARKRRDIRGGRRAVGHRGVGRAARRGAGRVRRARASRVPVGRDGQRARIDRGSAGGGRARGSRARRRRRHVRPSASTRSRARGRRAAR